MSIFVFRRSSSPKQPHYQQQTQAKPLRFLSRSLPSTSPFTTLSNAPFSDLVPIVSAPEPRRRSSSRHRRRSSRSPFDDEQSANRETTVQRKSSIPALPQFVKTIPLDSNPITRPAPATAHPDLPYPTSAPTSMSHIGSTRRNSKTPRPSCRSHARKRSSSDAGNVEVSVDRTLRFKKSLSKLKKSTTSLRNAFRSSLSKTSQVDTPPLPPLPVPSPSGMSTVTTAIRPRTLKRCPSKNPLPLPTFPSCPTSLLSSHPGSTPNLCDRIADSRPSPSTTNPSPSLSRSSSFRIRLASYTSPCPSIPRPLSRPQAAEDPLRSSSALHVAPALRRAASTSAIQVKRPPLPPLPCSSPTSIFREDFS